MAISIVQQAKNTVAYQVKPLVVTLPSGTTASSRLAVVVEAQKTGYPFNVGSLNANTTTPTITDDQGNTYTLVRSIVNQTQEVGSSPLITSPDASGFFPSLYVFVSSGAVVAGTKNISVGAFYTDEILSPPGGSPPQNGRPVFDGGIAAQVFEVAGLSSGVTASNYGSASVAALGAGLINSVGANGKFVLEAALLVDSSAISPAATATLQDTVSIYGGSSSYIIQTTLVNSGASAGFANPLQYSGAVIAIAMS